MAQVIPLPPTECWGGDPVGVVGVPEDLEYSRDPTSLALVPRKEGKEGFLIIPFFR